jgi:hypothetical protein
MHNPDPVSITTSVSWLSICTLLVMASIFLSGSLVLFAAPSCPLGGASILLNG